jgi:hypothetical protein
MNRKEKRRRRKSYEFVAIFGRRKIIKTTTRKNQ